MRPKHGADDITYPQTATRKAVNVTTASMANNKDLRQGQAVMKHYMCDIMHVRNVVCFDAA